ncbi:MAG: glycosyltransferase family 4 protein [Candidatus Dormibacteria bacterium]
MGRVLIIANDVVAQRMAGPGIRCVELGRELARAGHHVTLVGVGASDLAPESLEIVPQLSHIALDQLARRQDAILLQGIALVRYPSLRSVPVPLIVDLYDPFPLALLEQEAHRPQAVQEHESREIRKVLRELLRGGDFFLCASEVQRDLWTGALLEAGRVTPRIWAQDNSLRRLIDVVPFGLPDAAPQRHQGERQLPVGNLGPDDVVLLWGGGIYNWFDPLTLIRAVAEAAKQVPSVKLVFMSTDHPNASVPERMWMPARARQLSDQLGLTGSQVFFNHEWIAYTDRSRWLLASDCGVSTHFDHAETRYAFRTRMLDYLWCGLPIICTAGDRFAQLVAERDLGWVVPAEDVDSLTRAILEMATDPERRRRISRRVSEVAQDMTWERVSEPLLRFVANPALAADQPRHVWIHSRQPTPAELRAAEAGRLLRRAVYELGHNGPLTTTRKVIRWLRARRGVPPGGGAGVGGQVQAAEPSSPQLTAEVPSGEAGQLQPMAPAEAESSQPQPPPVNG